MLQTRVDDRYVLGGSLGSGGMARVYLAHDEVLDRDVALKVLREQYAEDEEFVERFRQEARSAARLSHPNIVATYDWGRSEEGTYYIAMEYVPGGTLKKRMSQEGTLDLGVTVGVALLISDALSTAHESGVIHRDIKPQNVLVTRTGSVKVMDFGIAQAVSSTATATSVVLGTAAYMSPEQAMGEPVGPWSDLYSLGVVLFEMLTGELPYKAGSPIAQAMQHVNEPTRSPREVNSDVPEELDALTVKLLAKNPEDRYASAAELADELERVRPGLAANIQKTERIDAPLPPLPPGREGQAERITVRLPVAPPIGGPGPGRRRREKLFPVLAELLFVGLLGVFALAQYLGPSEPEGIGDNSGTEKAAQAIPSPPTPPVYGKQKAAGKKK